MGVVVSSSHISDPPSSSGGGLLTLCPCSRVRSLSQETVLHKLLQHESFPWAAALHELPQRGSLPQGAVLQEQADPVWVPTESQALPENLLQCGVLSAWVHRSWQEPAPARAPHGVTASCRHPPAPVWGATGGDLLHHGPPWAAGGQPVSPWSSSRAASEGSLLRHLEHLLPLLLHCLQSCFSHIVSLLSLNCRFPHSFFLPS